jgi:tyrosine-protein phosphatase YwqE
MIDLHLHLLPDVDDGPSSMEGTRDMLVAMSAMGFQHLVTTPHLMQPLTPEYRNTVEQALNPVRELAKQYGVRVDLGYEHMFQADMVKRLKAGEPSTIAGTSSVLVELPFISWPQWAGSILFELRTAGYRPILAHPERYTEAQADPELALAAGERGITLQLSSGSFDGVYGKSANKLARHILNSALVRDIPLIMATDAHSNGQRLSRVPASLDWIRRNVANGTQVIEWATVINPMLILNDEPAVGFQRWHRSVSTWTSVSANAPVAVTEPTPRKSALRKALGLGTRSR